MGYRPKDSLNVPFDERRNQRVIIGSPDDGAEPWLRYQERLQANHLLLRVQWAGTPQEQALEAIELFGERIIPGLQDVWQPDGDEDYL